MLTLILVVKDKLYSIYNGNYLKRETIRLREVL